MATSVVGNPSAPNSASLQLTSIQPSTHTLMDPALWSRLPLEILSIIIENTADSKTLKSWRGATKDSTHLHCVATRTSYSTFTICEKDLLRAPKVIKRRSRYHSFGDDEASDCSPSGAKRSMRQLILELARYSYQKFAPHVRRLHLQFYFASSDRQMHLVRSEDVRHTLDMILPKATALQEIDHHGVLYQEMLNGILEVRSLKVLRVRQSWNDTPCSFSEGEFPRPRGLRTLDWSRLFHLHALKILLISQLYIDEAVGLAKAVKMRKLESLRVEIAEKNIRAANALSDAANDDDDDNDLPLTAFINALYRRDEGDASKALGFPSSLKALALVNSHSCHLNIYRLPENIAPYLPNLTKLYLDLSGSEEITDLFAFLNPYGLTQLLVSAYPEHEHSRQCSMYWACHHCDAFSRLVDQNSDTLQEITLLDAWQNVGKDGKEIRPPWDSTMRLQQIYLSKHSKASEKMAWLLHSKLFYGALTWRLWDEGVRHMRIDQLDLAKLKIYATDQAGHKFSQLKIVVLRSLPEQVRYEPPENARTTRYPYLPTGNSVLRSTPYPYLPFGPTLPEDMSTLREGRMATEIATHNLPSLRVIVVGEYKFWLQRMANNNDHASRRPKVWFLRHALEDPGQEAVIGQVMGKDDWDFVADGEDCLPEQAPREQVHWANRLVYRPRVDGQGS